MPLQLLPKKSWNVYSPANIARVRRDEALAAAAEAEADRKADEAEAAQRLRILRGESGANARVQAGAGVGADLEAYRADEKYYVEKGDNELDGNAKASADTAANFKLQRDPERDAERERRKRMRRRHGEDDTDRDIRIAKEEERERWERKMNMVHSTGVSAGARTDQTEDRVGKAGNGSEVHLFDKRGHIILFPEAAHGSSGKSASIRDPRKRKRDSISAAHSSPAASRHDAKDNRQNYENSKNGADNSEGTRLIDALTDRRGKTVVPWYNNSKMAGSSGVLKENGQQSHDDDDDNDNDEHYRRRSQAKRAMAAAKTTESNDPLAMIRRAQFHIKEAGKKKERVMDEVKEAARGDPYGKGYYYDRMRRERQREEKRERERETSERHRYKHKHRSAQPNDASSMEKIRERQVKRYR